MGALTDLSDVRPRESAVHSTPLVYTTFEIRPVFSDSASAVVAGTLLNGWACRTRLRVLRLVISAVAICLVATPVLAGPARDKKADKALRGALKGRTEQHAVILRVKPGTRRQIRLAIEQCGGVVKKEHQLIDALTVNVQGNCLDALLENQNVKSAGSDVSVTSTPVVGFSDDSS